MTTMSIGDAAQATGVPAWKLRKWDDAGLISPMRTEAGYRVFQDEDLADVRRVAAELEAGNRLRGYSLRVSGEAVPHSGWSAPSNRDGIHTLIRTVRNEPDPYVVALAGLGVILDLCGTEVGRVAKADPTQNSFATVVARGLSADYLDTLAGWRLHDGLIGRSFGLREALTVRDLSQYRGIGRAGSTLEGLRGYLCLPLVSGGRRIGAVEVFTRDVRDFTAMEVHAAEEAATLIATTLEAALVTEEVQDLAAQRADSVRHWTRQWTIARTIERANMARLLEECVASLDERNPQAMLQTIRQAAKNLWTADGSLGNPAVILHEQLAVRTAQSIQRTIKAEFGGWPELLPLDFSVGLALAAGQLLTRVADVSSGALQVRGTLNGPDLVIEISAEDSTGGATELRFRADDVAPLGEYGGRIGSLSDGLHHIVRIAVPTPEIAPGLRELTPREARVLDELMSGIPNREIAHRLGISPKTLQNHLTAIYRKLGATDRASAVAYAAAGEQAGLVAGPPAAS